MNVSLLARSHHMTKSDFEALAAFRRALRQFLWYAEESAQAAGISGQKYQALLAIKGAPGRDYITVGEIAEALLIKHNSAVELVDRLAKRGFVRRDPAYDNRRCVWVRLTDA